MIIFPAIDLRHGQCVRLLHGKADAQTTYSNNPASMAQSFVDAGATWLHVVNLDGAFGDAAGANKNETAIKAILAQVSIPIQVGGGIRSQADIDHLLNLGVSRVILGTMAVQQADKIPQIMQAYGPEQVILSIDAHDGYVATHGWQEVSQMQAIEFGLQMRKMGLKYSVYTDISRDGALTGSNISACGEMGRQTGLRVIVSGGVASLDDVQQAKDLMQADPASNLEGIITGRALYEGKLDLGKAIALAQADSGDQ